MEYISNKTHYDKKGTTIQSFMSDEDSIIKPFPGTEYITGFSGFASQYLSDKENLAIKNISVSEDEKNVVVSVDVYYITQNVMIITDGEEKLEITLSKDVVSKLPGFDGLYDYANNFNQNNNFDEKQKALQSKMGWNNSWREEIEKTIKYHKPNESVRFGKGLTIEQFRQMLIRDEDYYKSLVLHGNTYIDKTFTATQLYGACSMYLTLLACPALLYFDDARLKVLFGSLMIAPVLFNIVLAIAKRNFANKMFNELAGRETGSARRRTELKEEK